MQAGEWPSQHGSPSSCPGLPVVEMPVLPVQPGMAKFMGEDVAAASHGEPFSQVNRFQLVVPDAIGVGIATVHLGVRKLPDRDSITERQDHT